MQIIGIILIIIGIADFIQYDFWLDFFHLQLPDIAWRHSACVELLLGYLILRKTGSRNDEVL
ncbi:MAG: hypothetical protein P8Y43_02475 [Sulfurovaceae bacterium]